MGGLSLSSTSSSKEPLFPLDFFLFFDDPAFELPFPADISLPVGVGACDGVVCVDDGVGESYPHPPISTSNPHQKKTVMQ